MDGDDLFFGHIIREKGRVPARRCGFVGVPVGSPVGFTQVVDLSASYENEWGYSTRLVDLADYLSESLWT